MYEIHLSTHHIHSCIIGYRNIKSYDVCFDSGIKPWNFCISDINML